jgi:hypothetical protein
MASNPFRPCDYCGSSRQTSPSEPRLARRAWTVFHTTRKMACPRCWWRGHEEDDRLRNLISQHHALLRQRLVAEPSAEYGDAPWKQWERIKAQYPEAVLLFRKGDAYHAFGDDAAQVYRVCGVQLEMTRSVREPFAREARFHFEALERHLPALVKSGFRVAICDQREGPPVPGMVCEPMAAYKKPLSRSQRYLSNDRRMVLERLLDLETVLRRHKALPDYTKCQDKWQRDQEDNRAENAFWAAREKIALELRLREAELTHDSIRCRIGGAQCLFTATSLPRMIRDYRANTRNAA